MINNDILYVILGILLREIPANLAARALETAAPCKPHIPLYRLFAFSLGKISAV